MDPIGVFKRLRPVSAIVLAGLALGVAAPGPAGAQTAEMLRARRGSATPVDPAVYIKLPRARRHRAWLPPTVDLTARFPKPGDQQWQGACTAWSTGYAARSFLNSPTLGRAPNSPSELVSPEYIYNKIRPGKLSECFLPGHLTDALTLLQDEGAVTMAEFPYDVHACQTPPPEALRTSAAKWKIRAWRAIDHETPDDWRTPIVLDDIKGQLAQGLPIVFIMQSPKDFYDLKTPNGEIYRHPSTPANPGEFHAMALVGYDDNRQAVRLINSWGSDWGDHGYAWVDYDSFRHMATEAYVMEPFANGDSPTSPLMLSQAALAEQAATPDAGMAELVHNPGCGRLEFRHENGRRVISGFGGVESDLAFLKTKALAIDPAVEWRVSAHPWPQCEAELTLQKLMVDSPLKLSIADAHGAALQAAPVTLKKGDLFSIDVATSADHPFVHVIYLQADGSAVELYRAAPADGHVVVGANGARAVRFQVSPPLGDEIVIALASTGPLFDSRLGPHTTERQFLTMLRTRLIQANRDGTPIAGAVARIHTES